MSTEPVSRTELILLTLASAAITANAYYIHPIIGRVAQDFDVSAAMIGLVPAMNQVALALGIFLLLPLGDRFSNRRLVSIFVACQFFAIAGMAFAPDFFWFATASTLLGFFTIAPYLLPAYVSRRVEPGQLGHVTATLTTGVIMGILLARVGAGVIGEYLGWRVVYFIASVLMLAMAIIMPLIMVEDLRSAEASQSSYLKLLISVGTIVRKSPEVLLSGTIQALNFGLFLATWLALALHLTSPEMGYGVDVLGYLAGLAIVNLFATPRMGKFADRMGPRRARVLFAFIQAASMWLLYPFGDSLWLLIIPLVLMNLVGPPLDVSGRMLILSQAPDIRTRLTTVYIVMMFLGGGLASWAGTAAYAWGGWEANATLAVGISAATLVLSVFSLRRFGNGR